MLKWRRIDIRKKNKNQKEENVTDVSVMLQFILPLSPVETEQRLESLFHKL